MGAESAPIVVLWGVITAPKIGLSSLKKCSLLEFIDGNNSNGYSYINEGWKVLDGGIGVTL